MLSLFKRKRRAQVDLEDYIASQKAKGLDGAKLIPDPVPVAPPANYQRQPSLAEQIRAAVRSERLAAEAAAAGMETFEESEDFDIADDGEDLRSGWETDFDPPLEEIRQAVDEDRQAKAAAAKKKASPSQGPAEPAREALDGPDPE